MDFHPSILIDTARFTSRAEVPCGAGLSLNLVFPLQQRNTRFAERPQAGIDTRWAASM